jgi:hypothetical protein
MQYNKNQQIGRIFRKGSFWDRLLHTVAAFIPYGSAVVQASDGVGSDSGWFTPSKPATPPDELNYARNRQRISGISKSKTPKIF